MSEAPPDTLSARELRQERRQHPPSWPIWLAAGVALTVSAVAAFLLLRAASEPEAPKADLPAHVAHDPVPAAQPPEPPLPTVQLTPPPPPAPEPPAVVHEDPDAPGIPARVEAKPARTPRAARARARSQTNPPSSAPGERPAADKPAARNPADLLGF